MPIVTLEVASIYLLILYVMKIVDASQLVNCRPRLGTRFPDSVSDSPFMAYSLSLIWSQFLLPDISDSITRVQVISLSLQSYLKEKCIYKSRTNKQINKTITGSICLSHALESLLNQENT